MKRLIQWISSVLLIGFFLPSFTTIVQADELYSLDSYRITIVKYKMDDALKEAVRFPINGVKTDEITNTKGEALTPLANISYVIERVTPLQGTSGFEVVQGSEALRFEIKTNAQGEATIGDLPQGTYRVSEQRDTQLKEVMEPVVLELPLPQPSGESLKEVFLYPKSSVVEPGGSKEPGEKQPPKKIDKIPQTSGNIGNFYPILWSMAFVFLMGTIGMATIYWKRTDL